MAFAVIGLLVKCYTSPSFSMHLVEIRRWRTATKCMHEHASTSALYLALNQQPNNVRYSYVYVPPTRSGKMLLLTVVRTVMFSSLTLTLTLTLNWYVASHRRSLRVASSVCIIVDGV